MAKSLESEIHDIKQQFYRKNPFTAAFKSAEVTEWFDITANNIYLMHLHSGREERELPQLVRVKSLNNVENAEQVLDLFAADPCAPNESINQVTLGHFIARNKPIFYTFFYHDENGKLVATLTCSIDAKLTEDCKHEHSMGSVQCDFQFKDVYVLPEHRKKGYSRAIAFSMTEFPLKFGISFLNLCREKNLEIKLITSGNDPSEEKHTLLKMALTHLNFHSPLFFAVNQIGSRFENKLNVEIVQY